MESSRILLLAGLQNPEKIKSAFQLLISLGLKLLGAEEGSLLIYRKEQNDLQFAATIGNNAPEHLVGKTVPMGKGITGMAAMTCEIQTAARASGGDFFAVENDGSPNCVIAAPVMLDDELIGVITAVSFDKEKSFTNADCQNFSMLAELGAIIISQEQQLSNCLTGELNQLTEQSNLEMKAAKSAVDLIQKHPANPETILQILKSLGELK
ncbi:MAG: GAF domain-containing protein [Lentisphaeria bacterium]|nr:GAF domain-containing protein [Lentisphaeria bacterium]